MTKNYSILIFAPLPPPIGGISSIVSMLRSHFYLHSDILFVSPIPKSDALFSALFRFIQNLILFLRSCLCIRLGGRVLVFSSAYLSFYEKLLWALAAQFLGRRMLLVMVDGNFPRFWDKVHPVIKKLSSRVVSHRSFLLVVQSEGWHEYYSQIFSAARIEMVSATCDQQFFRQSKAIPIKRSSSQILFVGWVIQDKGILDLLDSIKILKEKNESTTVRIIGPLFGKEIFWNNEVKIRGISDRVNFLGSVTSRLSLIHEFDSALLFTLPSHFEGFPVTLLEAMARGVPCIGSAVGGIVDMLDHGNAGILVNPSNPNDLANAIMTLTKDRALADKFSKNAFFRAKKMYGYKSCMDSYKKLMELN